MLRFFLLYMLCFMSWIQLRAQEDLMSLAEEASEQKKESIIGTFKATRLVNGHTIETNGKGVLLFLISHRFGAFNNGAYHFFGLDQATIRLALEYGLSDRLNIGLGRSSLEKTYDGFLKYRILKQKSAGMPISLTAFSSVALTSLRWSNPELNYLFAHRLTYAQQLLIARKMNRYLSLQLSPTLIHRNLVSTMQDENTVSALGVGSSIKLTKRTTFNIEYFYLLPGQTARDYKNALGLGFDIETGGHVFQLLFSNSQGMIEKIFIPQNTGTWFGGDIYFGFNISRVFNLKGEKQW